MAVAVAAAVGLIVFASWRVVSSGGSANEVLVGASDFAFSSLELRAVPGEVEVTFANTDAVTHTFTVPSLGVDLVVASGQASTATFVARPGRHPFLCTIPGHDVPGMRGVLRIG